MRTNFDDIPEDLRSLIPDYLVRRKEDIKSLKTFIAKKDFDESRQLGHRLKGSGASYGFPSITDLGRKIEVASLDEDETKLSTLLFDFEREVEEALALLKQKLVQQH
jgi:HPt (histidine-containing phosphotransfer) domain-containing protein